MFTSRDGIPLVSSPRSGTRSSTRACGLAGALLCLSVSVPGRAQAADTSADMMKMTPAQFAKMDPMKAMKMMDPDGKGYVTREEFLKLQERLFNNIPKQDPDRVTISEWRSQATQNTGQ